MTTLIGTNPDQIPVNSMLGGMAYQDPDSVSVKNFNYSGTLLGLGNSSLVSTSGDISSTVHANNATGGAIAILRAGDGTTSSYYSYLRIVNNDSSPKTWDIGTKGNDDLRIDDGATTRFLVSSGIDHVMFNSGNTSFFIGNGATAGGGTTNDASFNWSLSGAVKLCRNSTLVAEIDSSNNLIIKTTGAIKVSEGTTAERPATPQEGMIRKNSTNGTIEGYTNGSWEQLNGGSLINTTLYSTAGDFVFTKNPRTKKLLVKMIGGGGSGATAVAGPHPSGWASAGGAGSPGTYVEFLLDATQSSYSVRVGAGGAAPSGAGQNGNDGQTSIFSEDGFFVTNHIQSGYGTGGLVIAAAPTPILGGVGNGSIPPSRSGVPSWKILSSCTAQPANWLILNSAWVTTINGNVNSDGKVLPPMSVFGPPMVLTHPCGAGGVGGYVVTGLGSVPAYSGERGAVLIYEYA